MVVEGRETTEIEALAFSASSCLIQQQVKDRKRSFFSG